jgi:hypothetical protein
MCAKRQRRCPALRQIREEALEEWCRAETLHAVRVAWGRLGGRVTLHRYGRRHFSELASLALRGASVGETMRTPGVAGTPYNLRFQTPRVRRTGFSHRAGVSFVYFAPALIMPVLLAALSSRTRRRGLLLAP